MQYLDSRFQFRSSFSHRASSKQQTRRIRSEQLAVLDEIFNANVRDLNNRVEMFPSSVIAGMFSFAKEEFFEVEEAVIRTTPNVSV